MPKQPALKLASKQLLTQSALRSILHYDDLTGWFTRLTTINKGKRAGTVERRERRVGTIQKCKYNCYRHIQIDGYRYQEHQLAWLYMTGRMIKRIDHRDGDGTNNIWSNLRKSTQSQNGANRGIPAHNTSGFKGVSKGGKHSWIANIQCQGRRFYLGTFTTPEEAAEAYRLKALELFGEFARCS